EEPEQLIELDHVEREAKLGGASHERRARGDFHGARYASSRASTRRASRSALPGACSKYSEGSASSSSSTQGVPRSSRIRSTRAYSGGPPGMVATARAATSRSSAPGTRGSIVSLANSPSTSPAP